MKTPKPVSTWRYGASTLCLAVVLQACGGGSSTADNNTGINQVASGAVTGFGSVFVDGVELEDANASVVTENHDGSTSNTVLQMGHRVRVAHNGKGTASTVTLDAAVIGLVSVKDVTARTLTVAGQKVRVVTDATVGAITVFGGGYSSIDDVVAGTDLVEVHGTPVYDSTSKSYTVNATRIAKVTESTGRMQVAGTISNLDATAKTFGLNGLTVNYATAVLRPGSATLANGTVVTAYAPLSALSGSTVTASHLKVNRLQDSTLSVSNAQIGGQVSKYDSTARTFEVQGVKVAMVNTTTINPSGKAVADGAYVKVTGTVGTDGSLTAANIQVREQSTSSDLAIVKLIGVVSDFVDNTSFVVRGVPVDASGINISEKCPGVTLANNVEVTVTATQQADTPVVLATNLVCKAQAAVVIRPVDGTASGVDSTAKTFTLTLTNSTTTQAVQWNSSTTFVGVTADTLDKSTVRVQGYLSGSTLVARTVVNTSTTGIGNKQRLDDAPFRTTADSATESWSRYRTKRSKN